MLLPACAAACLCCLGSPADTSAIVLQVGEHRNIFAGGDCIHVDSTQLAYYGMQHGQLVAANIKKMMAGKSKLGAWKRDAGFKVNIVTLGKKSVVVLFDEGCTTMVPSFVVRACTCSPVMLAMGKKKAAQCDCFQSCLTRAAPRWCRPSWCVPLPAQIRAHWCFVSYPCVAR